MLKRVLIFSSLLTLPSAGKALALDVVLGGTLQLELDFGVEKSDPLSFGATRSTISVSLGMEGSTDAGLNYGASLNFATSKELQISPYVALGGRDYLAKATAPGRTNIQGAVYAVSGGDALSNDSIVAVKIASDWIGVSERQTAYAFELSMQTAAICKLAGKANFAGGTNTSFRQTEVDTVVGVTQPTGNIGSFQSLPIAGWLVPGRLFHIAGTMAGAGLPTITATLEGTTTLQYFGSHGSPVVGIQLTAPDPISATIPSAVMMSQYNVTFYGDSGTSDDVQLLGAEIFQGPFMSVHTIHRSDKLVLGAACLAGRTDTKAYLDLAQDAVLVRDHADIFIEGGFGMVSLTSSGEAGSVSTIGSMDPKAEIRGTDLTLSYQGASNYAVRPGLALNLEDPNELLAHGMVQVGGVFAGFDIRLDLHPFSNHPIISTQGWELAAGYSGDLVSLQIGLDSEDDIGLTGELDLGSLSLYAEAITPAAKNQTFYGPSYLLSASYDADEFSVSGTIDEERRVTIAASYDLSILSIYGDFDFMSQEGRIGTTLKF